MLSLSWEKWQSQQLKFLNYFPTKKFKAIQGHYNSDKIMMRFLFFCRGPVLNDLQDCGITINTQSFADRLHFFCSITSVAVLYWWRISFKVFYRKRLNILCNFYIFGDLKKIICVCQFHSDKKMQECEVCALISELSLITKLKFSGLLVESSILGH